MKQRDRHLHDDPQWPLGDAAVWTSSFEQFERIGFCHRPVRLKGRSYDGNGEVVFDSSAQPGGELLKACGNRRVAVCPPCSRVYKSDIWHLVIAGLKGGKGLPASIVEHPAVFATFTAPSFGPVHQSLRHRQDGTCFPRRNASTCEHGVRSACWEKHDESDSRIGEPICPDCFDYENAVLWNSLAPELWRRTTVYVRRKLAREMQMTCSAFERAFRVSFLKVAEYQRRGLLHFHAIIRVDGRVDAQATRLPHAHQLEIAVEQAARTAIVPAPGVGWELVRWGEALDIASLDAESRDRAATYLAKYATKSTESVGAYVAPIHNSARLDDLSVSDHVRRFIEAAIKLSDEPQLAGLRLAKYAHQLGFRGHWTTKSRYYSTTLGAIREERRTWASGSATRHDGVWSLTGIGHTSRTALELCREQANEVQRVRRIARVELRSKELDR